MMKKILTLLLMGGSLCGFAQDTQSQEEKKQALLKLKPKYDTIDSLRNVFDQEKDVLKKEAIFNNFFNSQTGQDNFFAVYRNGMWKALAVGFAAVNNEAVSAAYIEKLSNERQKADALRGVAAAYARAGNYQKGISLLKPTLDSYFLPNGKLKQENMAAYDYTVKVYVNILPAGSGGEVIHYLKPYYELQGGFFPSDRSDRINNPNIEPKEQLFYHYAMALPRTSAREIAAVLVKAFETGAVPESMQAGVIRDFAHVPNLEQYMKTVSDSNKADFSMQVMKLLNKPDINGRIWGMDAFKGKYILLDFWGSWCLPCRYTHPHLKELYDKYKGKGLEIVGVAKENGGTIEQQKQRWKKAVAEDKIDWIQLLNNENEAGFDAVKVFGIGSFPTKILIDKKGKELARFGAKPDELEAKLKEVLGY